MNYLNTLFFQRCMTCKHKQMQPITSPLCVTCQKNLPWLNPNHCTQCATPLLDPKTKLCGNCIASPPHFDQTIALFSYEHPINLLIHDFKFCNRWRLATILGKWMHETLVSQWHTLKNPPSHLIAAPMHNDKLKKRGYNQALLLAKSMAKASGSLDVLLPCKKLSNNPPQSSLNRRQRKKASPHIIVIHPKQVKNKNLLLIDDVITTGSTLNSLAKSLKSAGANSVSVCCLSRTCHSK